MLARPMTRQNRLRIAVAWIAGLFALFVVCLAVTIDLFGHEDEARPAQAIVVLGSGVMPDGSPGDDLRSRVDHAVALFQARVAPAIVFTGARLDGPVSQAEAARRYAMSRGVPVTACFVEETSRHTAGNAREATRIIRENGWHTAVVTSDAFHLLRARQLFRANGLEVWTSPAPNAVRDRSPAARLFWTLREVAAFVVHPSLLVLGPPGENR